MIAHLSNALISTQRENIGIFQTPQLRIGTQHSTIARWIILNESNYHRDRHRKVVRESMMGDRLLIISPSPTQMRSS